MKKERQVETQFTTMVYWVSTSPPPSLLNANVLFWQVFFWISPCVWPNSGFWWCVFLTLWVTLLYKNNQFFGHSESAPTSAPWKMDDKWSGNIGKWPPIPHHLRKHINFYLNNTPKLVKAMNLPSFWPLLWIPILPIHPFIHPSIHLFIHPSIHHVKAIGETPTKRKCNLQLSCKLVVACHPFRATTFFYGVITF